MKSKITIEMDFENNTPVLQVNYQQSDDVRDKLIGEFFNKLGHVSEYFILSKVFYIQDSARYTIAPITPKDMKMVGANMVNMHVEEFGDGRGTSLP